MDESEYDAEAIAKRLSLRLEQQDYANELAGVTAGRPRRFFNIAAGNTGPHTDDEKDADAEFAQTLIRQAITAEIERRAEQFARELDLAETASYEALIDAREALAIAARHLKSIQARAHVLPDGTRVYLSEDGSFAIDESRNRLTKEQMAQVEWEAGRPTAEDWIEADDDTARAQESVDEIEAYRERLDKANERLESGEPMTGDELDEFEADIAAMPDPVRQNYERLGGALEAPAPDDGRREPRIDRSADVAIRVTPSSP